ncbi:hypothetical protein IW146_006639 [Coemansia sp. RSA 922]|nr:hypothetical protein IW146_006639 [Coemansia sp. RSA 922]
MTPNDPNAQTADAALAQFAKWEQENPDAIKVITARLEAKRNEALNRAKKHAADSMKELLIAEENAEQNLLKRADTLRLGMETREAEKAALRKELAAALAQADEEYDALAASLVEESHREQAAIETLKKVAEASRELALAVGRNMGVDEEYIRLVATPKAPTTQLPSLQHTAAQVVSGAQTAELADEVTMTERERLAEYTAGLEELERRCELLEAAEPMSFFVPGSRNFEELTVEEEAHAEAAFGKPTDNMIFKGMTVIALRQADAGAFDRPFSEIRRMIVAAIHKDMTLFNMSYVNSNTMELLFPAKYYAHLCMYLTRIGQVLATRKPCYLTGCMPEPTLFITLKRWKNEAKGARSSEGRAWYAAALDAYHERTEGRHRQYMPTLERSSVAASAIKNLSDTLVDGRNLKIGFADKERIQRYFGNNAWSARGSADGVAKVVEALAPVQKTELLAQFKSFAAVNTTKAREELARNPALAHALLCALESLGLVKQDFIARIKGTAQRSSGGFNSVARGLSAGYSPRQPLSASISPVTPAH